MALTEWVLGIGLAIGVTALLYWSGGFAVISEVLAWVRQVVSWVFSIKWLSFFVIFLLLITVVPMVISLMLNMFYVCDGGQLFAWKYPIIDGVASTMYASNGSHNTTGFQAYLTNQLTDLPLVLQQ